MTRIRYFVQSGPKADQLPMKVLLESEIRGEACGKEALSDPANPGDAAHELIHSLSVPPQLPSVTWLRIHCEGEAARAASCLSLTFASLQTLQFPVLLSLLLPFQTQPFAICGKGSPPQL